MPSPATIAGGFLRDWSVIATDVIAMETGGATEGAVIFFALERPCPGINSVGANC